MRCSAVLGLSCVLALATVGRAPAQVTAATPSANADGVAPTPSAMPTLLENVATDPAETIHVRVGQTFVIALRANHSTGFSWQLAPQSDATVATIGSAYESPTPRIGAAGQEIWSFRAVAAGAASLVLRYGRPFESGSSKVASTVAFSVEVAP